jgi:hypothetical protein
MALACMAGIASPQNGQSPVPLVYRCGWLPGQVPSYPHLAATIQKLQHRPPRTLTRISSQPSVEEQPIHLTNLTFMRPGFTVSNVCEFNFPRRALAYTLAGG